VKAPEVGWASVPGVLKEGQPGPHSRGPQAPFLGVIGFSECRIDVFREDMEPPVEISLCASRQPALDIIATPFDPAVDLLDLSAKVAKLRKRFGQGRRSIWQRRGTWHRNMNVLYRAELRENERRKIWREI